MRGRKDIGYLTIGRLADVAHVDRATIRTLIRNETIKAEEIPDRRLNTEYAVYVIDYESALDYLKGRIERLRK